MFWSRRQSFDGQYVRFIMESVVLLSFLKQRAKQLKKGKSLSQSQALNEAAKELGYSNYKNYLNLLEANRKQSKPSKEVILKNISSEDDMLKKMGLAISFIQKYEIPIQDLLGILKLFQDSEAMQFVCEQSNLKDKIQSFFFNDFLTDEGKSEIQMHDPYYVAKDISLNNLIYKINGDMIEVEGNYDLKIGFEFEVEDEYKEYPHFKDRSLSGPFEITIDRAEKITIEYTDIYKEFDDGTFQAASFR